MKTIYAVLLSFFGFFGVAGILLIGIYWGHESHDRSCLIKIAEDYCINQNLTYYPGSLFNYAGGNFVCIGEKDVRKHTASWNNFYFLPSELDSCKNKKAYTFRRLR